MRCRQDAFSARRFQFHIGNNSLGNVATNVLLTLLSESVLAGVGAFVFSTVAITFLAR